MAYLRVSAGYSFRRPKAPIQRTSGGVVAGGLGLSGQLLIAKLLVSIGRNPSVQMAWTKHSRQPGRRQSKLNHSRIKRLNVASELALIHIEGGWPNGLSVSA